MKLTYLKHSAFLIEGEGATILTDPYPTSVGYKMPKVSPNIVSVSHHHYDHCDLSAVSGKYTLLEKAGSYNVDGVKITAIPSFHDDCQGRARGENLIFVFEIDGIIVCHMGDIGEKFSQFDFEKLPEIDVLLIPVGGNYTIDAVEAAKYIRKISPKVAIPMHYNLEGCRIDIESVERFKSVEKCIQCMGSLDLVPPLSGNKTVILNAI